MHVRMSRAGRVSKVIIRRKSRVSRVFTHVFTHVYVHVYTHNFAHFYITCLCACLRTCLRTCPLARPYLSSGVLASKTIMKQEHITVAPAMTVSFLEVTVVPAMTVLLPEADTAATMTVVPVKARTCYQSVHDGPGIGPRQTLPVTN